MWSKIKCDINLFFSFAYDGSMERRRRQREKNNDEKISTSSHRMASIVSDLKNGEGKKNKVLDKKSSIHYGHWTLFVVQRM